MKNFLRDHNYTMEQAISGYFYCQHNNEDGTSSVVWMDSACEDAYDLDAATAMAYDIIIEMKMSFIDSARMKTFIFKNESGNGYLVATAYSIDEARENIGYGNYIEGEMISEMGINEVCPIGEGVHASSPILSLAAKAQEYYAAFIDSSIVHGIEKFVATNGVCCVFVDGGYEPLAGEALFRLCVKFRNISCELVRQAVVFNNDLIK